MAKQLLEPALENGIQTTNFVNNRILMAEDLRTDQQANQQKRQQFGMALGAGVVSGLNVTAPAVSPSGQPPILTVTAGLALNRSGQALALPDDTQVALAAAPPGSQPADAGLFANCAVASAASAAPGGVYVLLMSPVSGFQGLAPTQNLFPASNTPGCVSRYVVEGVTFRLLPLPLPNELAGGLGDPQTLRNRLAYLCYGYPNDSDIPGFQAFAANPFQFSGSYGALDKLRGADQNSLTDCDIPLALLYWTDAGIQFCDTWAAQRRPVPPPLDAQWEPHVGQRRQAEAEAMFLQFQNQLDALQQSESNPAALTAASRFRYLPAGGYLPTGTGGFNRDVFFSGVNVLSLPLSDGLTLSDSGRRELIGQSFRLEPIDLSAPPPVFVYEDAAANYLIFLRADDWQPITARQTASLQVNLDFSNEFYAYFVNDYPKYAEFITLTLTNSAGQTFAPVSGPTLFTGDAQFGWTYQFTNLLPGTYSISVIAPYFMPQTQAVSLTWWQTLKTDIEMTRRYYGFGGIDGGIERPRQQAPNLSAGSGRVASDAGGAWLKPGWYGKITAHPSELRWPWPPDAAWQTRTPQGDPPPDALQWQQSLAANLADAHSKAPIDAAQTRIFVDPDHTPDQVAAVPYAYLVMGANGAYLPLTLTPNDHLLDRPVSVTKGALAGVDDDTAMRLGSVGIHDLDTLAAAPSSLVGQALSLDADSSAGLITDARAAVATLQNSLRTFSGVGPDLNAALTNAGFASARDLANATPQVLAEKLGGSGVNAAFAQRLVAEARQVVPASAWSLNAPELGLKTQDITALQGQGIATQAQLQFRVSSDEGKQAVASLLGSPVETIATLTGGVERAASAFVTQKADAVPVTSLTGVNSDIGKGLASIGAATVGGLKNRTPESIAPLFGGDVARAAEIITAAKTAQENK